MSNNLRSFLVSSESHEDGNKEIELEYTFYGHIADFEELKKAFKSERQEQWSVPLDTDVDGKMRIRKVDDQKYLMCTKIKREGQRGVEEVEMVITEDMYNHLREFAEDGTIKTRYFFKIEDNHDMVWEIDVFKSNAGEDHAWVKIDLEVKDETVQIPEWPIEFQDMILHQKKEQTEAEADFIHKLWDKEWAKLES